MHHRSDERGAVTVVAITTSLILCVGALAAADLGSMLFARASAQSAADAAALAAVVAEAPILGADEDPQRAARAEAESNGAELVSCDCPSGGIAATVAVRLTPKLAFLTGWFGRKVRADARAELDPDVLSYRDPAGGG
jgi:secretion/DNA translocation related TadE-like protein